MNGRKYPPILLISAFFFSFAQWIYWFTPYLHLLVIQEENEVGCICAGHLGRVWVWIYTCCSSGNGRKVEKLKGLRSLSHSTLFDSLPEQVFFELSLKPENPSHYKKVRLSLSHTFFFSIRDRISFAWMMDLLRSANSALCLLRLIFCHLM